MSFLMSNLGNWGLRIQRFQESKLMVSPRFFSRSMHLIFKFFEANYNLLLLLLMKFFCNVGSTGGGMYSVSLFFSPPARQTLEISLS